MGQITDYPKIQSLVNSNVFLVDGESGTKGILAKDLGKSLLDIMTTKEILDNIDPRALESIYHKLSGNDSVIIYIDDPEGTSRKIAKNLPIKTGVFQLLDAVADVGLRRSIWRGKNLGTVVSNDQYYEIEAGTFRDMFLGDYWEIGGKKWRIMDFDYWLNLGDIVCTTHHVMIMPDYILFSASMNDTDTTNGGYLNSNMRTNKLAEAASIIYGAFPQKHLLVHRNYYCNAVLNGHPNGLAWTDSNVDLPNELMIHGCFVYTPASTGEMISARATPDTEQLAGFRIGKDRIKIAASYWLRDVASNSSFTIMSNHGTAGAYPAHYELGVRPIFAICKENDEYFKSKYPQIA